MARAPSAYSNSFTMTIDYMGTYSYNDGADRFCVKAHVTASPLTDETRSISS